jgi:acyl-CoA thioesterase
MSGTPPAADLCADTTAREVDSDGSITRFEIDLPDSWDFANASGGVLMSLAIRAMQAKVDPRKVLMSATTTFCSPVTSGPLRITVTKLHEGSTAAQLRARVDLAGASSVGLECAATFVKRRDGFEVDGVRCPEVSGPLECEDALDEHHRNPHTKFRFFRNFDTRVAGARLWEGDFEAGEARWARWFRYRVPQTTGDGHLDPLALTPVADTMPGAITAYLGPKAPRFYAPSLDLTLHALEPTSSEWILVDSRCHWARGGFASTAAYLWSEERALIGYATQTMLLKRGRIR